MNQETEKLLDKVIKMGNDLERQVTLNRSLTDQLARLAQILGEVERMRSAQRDYFTNGRAQSILTKSKQLESRVDGHLKQLRKEKFLADPEEKSGSQTGLF
jgi:hypothetical protein